MDTISRKSFLASLGAAGVGAGLLRFAPPAAAQDDDDDFDGPSGMMHGDWEAKRIEIYAAFTEALAAELGDTTADEVDAAIRTAIMTLIDDHVSDDGLTKGQAEALKVVVATTDVPITPGFMGAGMGMGPHGGMMRGGHGDFRVRMRDGRGRRASRGRRRGDGPMAPGAPDAPSAPDTPLSPAPDAPATPEAGA